MPSSEDSSARRPASYSRQQVPSAPPLRSSETEEYPRDNERSRLKGREYKRVFGIGGDEFDLFEVYPSPRSVEKGVQRLKEMAAALGANEVRDVYFTGYAEHQMWEGDVVSVTPTSPDSPIYTNIQLLEFRLRDVRFHGTAVVTPRATR